MGVIPVPQLSSSQLVAVEGWQQEVKAHLQTLPPGPSRYPIS